MTYAAHHRDFVPYFPYQTSTGSNAVTNKAGVLRRIFDAIFESRQKQPIETSPASSPGRAGASPMISSAR